MFQQAASASVFAMRHLSHHASALCKPLPVLGGLISWLVALYVTHATMAPPLCVAFGKVALGAFVLDAITGTIRSLVIGKKNRRNVKKINSKDMGGMIVKGTYYLAFSSLGFLYDTSFHTNYSLITIALGIIATRESLSNLENGEAVYRHFGWKWPFAKFKQSISELLPGEEKEDTDEQTP